MLNEFSESQKRLCEKLHHDLGNDILHFLQDEDVNEIMLNPDGRLWIDSVAKGLMSPAYLTNAQALMIINTVAGLHNFVVNQQQPRLEAELPFFRHMQGERFTAQVPPLVAAPSFTIRKKPAAIFTLEDYILTGRATCRQTGIIKALVGQRKNVLICGGPGSGKTTVANALIAEAVKNDNTQRFIVLEDLPELQCSAPNKVTMLTSDTVNMTALLRTAMRMRPDRILIGEVRGAEALDMLKAWNTGCPGGICTVHANGAEAAVQRVIDLAMEAGLAVAPIQLVLHTIDAVVSIARSENHKGFIKDIVSLRSYDNGRFSFEKLA